MAIDIEVIFTGLALFCLNEGEFCAAKPDRVYLVNALEPATVCDRQLDGGHEPVLTFDADYLLRGSALDYEIVRTGADDYTVVAPLTGTELCICVESPGGCSEGPGAVPVVRELGDHQKEPSFFQVDEDGFDWVPDLADLVPQGPRNLCPQVDGQLYRENDPDYRNELVVARVRLDDGEVLTAPGWHDGRSVAPWKWVLRLFEADYQIWDAAYPGGEPEPQYSQRHFPKALPGHAMWRLPDIPDGSIVLLNDCAREPQRTLFRLRARGDDIQLHVTNAPTHAHDLPRGGELEHFRWYYRLVDWQLSDPGCRQLNSIEDACPSNLPVPRPPDALLNAIYETKSAPSKKKHSDLFGVITQTVKCPPGSAGSTPSSD